MKKYTMKYIETYINGRSTLKFVGKTNGTETGPGETLETIMRRNERIRRNQANKEYVLQEYKKKKGGKKLRN